MWKPDLPYNELPFPPVDELETRSILRAAANARAALAGLDQAGQTDSQPRDSHLPSLLEAQASSEIENIVTTTDDLFRDENLRSAAPDPAVKETLRYREALFAGLKEVRRRPLNTNIALEVSSHISGYNMELRSLPGTFIGNPTTLEARYTPPEGKELIARKLGDWEKIVHIGDELDPLVAMAVAHYQFEAIHPFTDSNGRTGRILNILMLIERRLLSEPVLYLSRYIIENKNEYYDRLLAVTRDGAWHEWLSFMLSAVHSTSEETLATIDRIQGLRRTIREQMRSNRGSSNADLLDLLLERPYCRIADVENACNVTRPTATKRLEELVAAGVLDDRRAGRDRLFVNVPLMEILRNPGSAEPAR